MIDTREQAPLIFPVVKDVEVVTDTLVVGDYTARHQVGAREIPDPSVVERKSIPDLYASFSQGYEREKAKWVKAKQLGLRYILAIEGTISDILQGNTYWKAGERQEGRKSGLAQIRQLCTLQVKYDLNIWYCVGRKELAFYLVEYFLASGRWLAQMEEKSA